MSEAPLKGAACEFLHGTVVLEKSNDVLSLCINNEVVAVFIPNLDDVILIVDGAATMLA